MKSVQHFFQGASLSSVKTIAGLSLLLALYVLLNMLTINLSPTLRIRFSFAALALSCWLYGLWPNLLFAAAADLLGFLVHPDGTYVPLLALVLMVKAAIYCLFFYGQREIPLWKIVAAQFLVDLVANVLLNPLLLSWMYQMPYWALVVSRLVKNAILWPVESLLLIFLFRYVLSRFGRTFFRIKTGQ